MRILVTGSNGLLGQKLTVLLGKDRDVYLIATARGQAVLPVTKGEFRSLDVCNGDEVSNIVSATRPDVIIHTAAMTNVDQCETDREGCWLANVTAVENLIRACEKNSTRLIHLSTDFIFDGSHGPLDENEEAAPVNYYGESKLAAEVLIRRSKIHWAILRTVLVYGITRDMSRSNIVLWVKKNLEEGKPINVVDDQFRTPTLAEDLAMGCYLAAKQKAQGVFHISGKDFLSPYEIAIHTARYFNLDESLIRRTDSSTFKQPARRPLVTGFVIDKAMKELGYEPHSFIDGIRIMAEQLKSPELA
jgi:dTDP-4-dehydrorhamnose reductase